MQTGFKLAILMAGLYEALCILTVLLTSVSLSSNRLPRTVVQSAFVRDPAQITSSVSCDSVTEFNTAVVPISSRSGLLMSYIEYSQEMFTDFGNWSASPFNDLYEILWCLPSVQTNNVPWSPLGNVTQLLESGCQNGLPRYEVQFVHEMITTDWFGLNFTSAPEDIASSTFGDMSCFITTHHTLGVVTKTCFMSNGYYHALKVGQKYKQLLMVYPSDPTETVRQSLDASFWWYRGLEQRILNKGLICKEQIVVNQEYLTSTTFHLDGAIIYVSIASVALFVVSMAAKFALFNSGYVVVHGGAIFPAFQISGSNDASIVVEAKV